MRRLPAQAQDYPNQAIRWIIPFAGSPEGQRALEPLLEYAEDVVADQIGVVGSGLRWTRAAGIGGVVNEIRDLSLSLAHRPSYRFSRLFSG